jgi:hypothetical protein
MPREAPLLLSFCEKHSFPSTFALIGMRNRKRRESCSTLKNLYSARIPTAEFQCEACAFIDRSTYKQVRFTNKCAILIQLSYSIRVSLTRMLRQ